ncbi:MAG: serine--tRNA ligase, partial [Acidobacteriaceae bacterium]
MLDLGFVRTNLELVERKLRERGADPAALLGDFRELDQERRANITRLENLRAQYNIATAAIAKKKQAGEDASTEMEEMKSRRVDINTLAMEEARIGHEFDLLLSKIPNLTRDEVPVGKDERDNVEVKKWGTPRQFDFQPKPHWELGEQLGILDLERAAKISGARFAVYWGDGAKLERALISFMLAVHTQEHGYTEVLPPFMVNSKSLFGTGQLPKFAEDLFRCNDAEGLTPGEYRDNDHWLIPTAEVPVTNLYRDEVLEDAELPASLTAYTPCFRSEAGSYGKDVRGIIRQHQFQKVELVKFVRPEESDAEHEKLTRDAENILERLELPYRRMLLCTGDTGFSSAK